MYLKKENYSFYILLTAAFFIRGNCGNVVKKCELFNACKKNSGAPNWEDNTHLLSFAKKSDLTSKKCKSKWKSYWNCEELSESEKKQLLAMEFLEDYPDWTKDYWMWRSKYVENMTLKVDVETEGSLMIDVSFSSNSNTSTGDKLHMKKFKTKFLNDLENAFCFHTLYIAEGKPTNFSSTTLVNASFVCTHVKTKAKKVIQDVYIGLLFVASVFLLLTCVVYLIIWDNQTLHGWAIFSEVLSNFFMILTVGLSHYYVRDLEIGPASVGCISLAISSHFFFLSTFCWMTVINYNLWKTFRQLRNPAGRHSNKFVTYGCYALFAIGVPLTLVMLCILVDQLHARFSDETVSSNSTVSTIKKVFMRPHYGKKFCYMAREAQGHYIYYPIGTLIATNSLLFGLTTFSLLKHRKETQVLEGSRNVSTRRNGRCDNCTPSQPASSTQSIFVFAKLFSIMGVAWVFEVLAWAFSKPGENVPLYWIIFDVTNLVQAIAVFVIFVCKKEVFDRVKKKFAFIS